ncbi:MAG: anaerobic ribonucleoside-triphosphate reductase activating protein [Paludibacteraceae bacterium]|nr:anaerobic ribonucleoside-triphosphate reductase activating protein [Paludibacteraceae bacterium]
MLKYADYDIVFSEIPDEVTLAINISNCPNHCPGCHSPWLMDDIGFELNSSSLEDLIVKYGNGITCICFMGGDIAPKELESLAIYIHEKHPSIKVGWYSGKDKFAEGIELTQFQFIKIGGYKEAYGSLKSKTTNQRLYKILPDGEKEDLTYRFNGEKG